MAVRLPQISHDERMACGFTQLFRIWRLFRNFRPKVKVKVHTLDIVPLRSESLPHGCVFSRFYLFEHLYFTKNGSTIYIRIQNNTRTKLT